MKILFLNGANLNLQGIRELSIYGSSTLAEINERIQTLAKEHQVEVSFLQSNHEGDLIDVLHDVGWKQEIDCIIFNPGAFSHYSYALRDAVASLPIPVIEVHLSNIYQREGFRQKSIIAPVAKGQITGFGEISYIAAFYIALNLLNKDNYTGDEGDNAI